MTLECGPPLELGKVSNGGASQADIKFITPAGDPVSAPVDAGTDPANIPAGANEFTFSDATSGVLTLKLKVRVSGLSGMSASEQAQYLFTVDAIGNSQVAWDGGTDGQPTINGEFLEAKVTFTGLPEHNTDFGLKAAKLKKAGSTVATAKYEVFFPKNGKNHPGGQTGSENWFHYWREGGVCGIPLNTSTFSDVPANNPYLMAVTYPQSGDPIIRFTTNAAKELTQRQYLGKGGRGSIIVRSNCKGIHCIAVTVEHEQTHMND